MEKFSNWVEKRDEINISEGLAHGLVELNIDPQRFAEWVLDVAKRGELNKVDLNEGMFDYLRGLGGAIKQSGVNWHQQAQNYAQQQRYIALAKNAQSIIDKLKYDLLELGIGRKDDKHRNEIKNTFAYFQQRLEHLASKLGEPAQVGKNIRNGKPIPTAKTASVLGNTSNVGLSPMQQKSSGILGNTSNVGLSPT